MAFFVSQCLRVRLGLGAPRVFQSSLRGGWCSSPSNRTLFSPLRSCCCRVSGQWTKVERHYSPFYQAWQRMRETVQSQFQTVQSRFHSPRVRPNSPLLLWGAVAFLWERERVSSEEINRCLREYEERVRRQLASSWRDKDSDTSHSDRDGADSSRTQASQSLQSTTQEAENSNSEHKRESQRSLFIKEARLFMEEHSQRLLSELPLVGLKQKSLVYALSFSLLKLLKSAAMIAMSQVEQRPLLLRVCRALGDTHSQQVFQQQETSFTDSCLEGSGWCFSWELTNEIAPTGHMYPPVGLKPRDSKILLKFFRAVRKLLIEASRENLHHSFDHILGLDGAPDHSLETHKQNRESPEQEFGSATHRTKLLSHPGGVSQRTDGEHVEVKEKPGGSSCRSSPWLDVTRPFEKQLVVLANEELVRFEGAVSGCSLPALHLGADFPDSVTAVGECPEGQQTMPEASEKDEGDHLAGWELLTQQPNCTVYRKPYQDTGLFQFKVIGFYDDITANDFVDVQMDSEARQSWDSYTSKLDTIDSDPRTGSEVIHWVMKYPFPMSSREYVYIRRAWISPNEDAIVLINRSVDHPAVPESRRMVRVRSYFSEMVIKPHCFIDELGLDYELTYFDNPRTYLPSSCVNWVTTTAMPDFLSKMHNAALKRRYSEQRQIAGHF